MVRLTVSQIDVIVVEIVVIVVEIVVNVVLRKALVSDVILYSIARIFGAMA